MNKKLVFGVGINDIDYPVKHKNVEPYYTIWHHMLRRCYSTKYQLRQPTYIGCTVAPEWLYFSKFKEWMIFQDWKGNQLDKDILYSKNKLYSPDTCIFINPNLNKLLNKLEGVNKELPIGVSYSGKKYRVRCCSLENKNSVYIGSFTSIDYAAQVYLDYKARIVQQISNNESNPRIQHALQRISVEIQTGQYYS